jgi:hypothetical protein
MPSESKDQQAFMGAELARKRAGKPTKTKMTTEQLLEFARTPTKNLPQKVPNAKNRASKS